MIPTQRTKLICVFRRLHRCAFAKAFGNISEGAGKCLLANVHHTRGLLENMFPL